MFMFADVIVFMNKSHRRKDTVHQQERARHMRPHLPRESVHHRFVQHRGQPFTFTFHVKEGLHHCNVARSPVRRLCGFTGTGKLHGFSSYGGHTSKSSNIFMWFFIVSPPTPSPTIHLSFYISMVHHDKIYIFSLDRIFVCGYVLSCCMCVCMCTHGGQSYFLYLE
jgi:hypothetical protein